MIILDNNNYETSCLFLEGCVATVNAMAHQTPHESWYKKLQNVNILLCCCGKYLDVINRHKPTREKNDAC